MQFYPYHKWSFPHRSEFKFGLYSEPFIYLPSLISFKTLLKCNLLLLLHWEFLTYARLCLLCGVICQMPFHIYQVCDYLPDRGSVSLRSPWVHRIVGWLAQCRYLKHVWWVNNDWMNRQNSKFYTSYQTLKLSCHWRFIPLHGKIIIGKIILWSHFVLVLVCWYGFRPLPHVNDENDSNFIIHRENTALCLGNSSPQRFEIQSF